MRRRSRPSIQWPANSIGAAHVSISIIDAGGGESSPVDDPLALGCLDVTVLDISATLTEAIPLAVGASSSFLCPSKNVRSIIVNAAQYGRAGKPVVVSCAPT